MWEPAAFGFGGPPSQGTPSAPRSSIVNHTKQNDATFCSAVTGVNDAGRRNGLSVAVWPQTPKPPLWEWANPFISGSHVRTVYTSDHCCGTTNKTATRLPRHPILCDSTGLHFPGGHTHLLAWQGWVADGEHACSTSTCVVSNPSLKHACTCRHMWPSLAGRSPGRPEVPNAISYAHAHSTCELEPTSTPDLHIHAHASAHTHMHKPVHPHTAMQTHLMPHFSRCPHRK